MSKEDLRKSLDALHAELDQLTAIEPTTKQRIDQLIQDLEQQIETPDDLEPGAKAKQKLPTLIEQFEADHPRMTESLNHLMVTLSGMGL